MKNTFASPKYKKLGRSGFLGFLTLLIMMNLLLTSCVDEPEAPKIEVDETTQVAKVKAWFEENKTKLRLPERGSNFRTESQELILPFFEKEPDWDKFHHYYFPDGREVFEVNLANVIKYFPKSLLDNFPNTDVDSLVIQNIMFIKHPVENRFDPLIARYYPRSNEMIKKFTEIYYLGIDESWIGSLEIWTFDEHHFVGFEFDGSKGINTYRYSIHSNQPIDTRKTFINSYNLRDECITTREVVEYRYIGGPTISEGGCICPVYGDVTRCFPSSNTSYGGTTTTYYDYSSYYSSGGSSYSTNTEYNPPSIPNPEFLDPEEKRRLQLEYLRTHGQSEFVNLVEQLLSIQGITYYEVMEINSLVNNIYYQVKGNFMMAIFSPENLGQILFLALSSNVSNELRSSILNSLPRYTAYNDIYLLIGNKYWSTNGVSTTFLGFTNHGAISYRISKGFTPSLIKSILNQGTEIRVPYNGGYQLRILYPYEGRTIGIVIDSNVGTSNFGKIITYLTNY